jgi:hypothetical protein
VATRTYFPARFAAWICTVAHRFFAGSYSDTCFAQRDDFFVDLLQGGVEYPELATTRQNAELRDQFDLANVRRVAALFFYEVEQICCMMEVHKNGAFGNISFVFLQGRSL